MTAGWFCQVHTHTMVIFRHEPSVPGTLEIHNNPYCPQCWREQRQQILAIGYRRAKRASKMIIRKAAIRAFAVLLLALVLSPALARDDGRYANDPNKDWINSLTDEIGNVCCSVADGRVVDGPDWGGNPDGTYWVMVDGQKLDVPPTALVIQRNRLHRALVWPFVNGNGELRVRCFLPGAGT